MIRVRLDKGKIILDTLDPSIKYLLEVTKKDKIYLSKLKKWRFIDVVERIYNNKKIVANEYGIYSFELGLGWAPYIATVFKNNISTTDYDRLCSAIRADNYREFPFMNLRQHQNEDVLHLLKFKIGLCTVNTGYGKTQVIATLANYAYTDLNKSVLLVTPGKKAKDELVKRCKQVFGLDIPSKDGRLDCIITSGVGNSKKYKDPALLSIEEAKLAKVDWVLVDEVEYTINPGGEFIYERLKNADHFYGFSGTADKYQGKMISFANGLDETVMLNKDLIKYFGPSLIYRMPTNLSIDMISVRTLALNNIKINTKDDTVTNVFQEVMNTIWTNPAVCECIVKIIEKYPKLYIPMVNLNTVITHWIDNYFKYKFRILLICGEGYIYYDIDGTRTKLTLEECCDYVARGLVDVVPGTSSSFRALDLQGMTSALMLSAGGSGKVAGCNLQSIGRVARSTHMNIITLHPKFPTRIPVFTKGAREQDEMLRNYYKYCPINDITINEEDL